MSKLRVEGRLCSLEIDLWTFHLDFQGSYPLSRLVSRMVHVAGEHASHFGFGIRQLMEHQYTWVLNRMSIDFLQEVDVAKPLLMTTGVRDIGGLATHRVVLLSQGGSLVATSLSRWVAIGLKERKPVPIDEVIRDRSVVHDFGQLSIAKIPRTVIPLSYREQLEKVYEREVRYSDLDINRHVNSSVWVEVAMDALPLERLEGWRLRRAHLHFAHEGVYGDMLSVSAVQGGDDSFDAMSVESRGQEAFLLSLEWDK